MILKKYVNLWEWGLRKMSNCIAVNIQDMLKAIGEEELLRLLSDFSCPLNTEVEDFVRKKAIDFAKENFLLHILL